MYKVFFNRLKWLKICFSEDKVSRILPMQILRSEGSLSVTLNKTWLSTHCNQNQHSPFLKSLKRKCSGCLIIKNKSKVGGYIEGHDLRYLMAVRKSKTDVDLLIFYCIQDSTTRQHSRGELYQ